MDFAAAEKIPGVVKVAAMKKRGDEIRWQGDPLVVVVGESEGAVAEGLKAIKVDLRSAAGLRHGRRPGRGRKGRSRQWWRRQHAA